MQQGAGLTARYGSVRASFRIFGDEGAAYQSPPDPGLSRTSFTAGSIDFFSSVQISDHFHVLSEVVGEFEPETNEVGFEIERLWGSWISSDRFYLKFGREHSPMSRWNHRFHHGKHFWPAATQPFMARFEDLGGPLPIHAVGMEIGGRIGTSLGEFEYTGGLSNGRGLSPEEVSNARDHNDAKALDLGLSFVPRSAPRLRFGAGGHADRIPPDPSDPNRLLPMSELIGSSYLEFRGDAFDLLAEAALISHRDDTSGRDFSHRTGYIQAGFRLGDYTPYARLDVRVMGEGDPFFEPTGLDLDRWEQLIGLRHDFNEGASIKVEAGTGHGQARDALGRPESRSFGSAALQLAWVF